MYICVYIHTHTYIRIHTMSQLIHCQFLNKVPANILRIILAFLIYPLPRLGSDDGPTPCLFKQVQVTKGYHSNHSRIGCNMSDCIFSSSSEKYMPFKELNFIIYWRVNSILRSSFCFQAEVSWSRQDSFESLTDNYLLFDVNSSATFPIPWFNQLIHRGDSSHFLEN